MPIDFRNIDPDLSYSLKEVAQLLELAYGTVLKLRKDKKLKYTKIGKKYYIKGQDILSYVFRNTPSKLHLDR